MAIKDISGERFGLLTVIDMSGVDNGGTALWLCQCDCGEKRIVAGTGLRAGRNKSCGCKSPKFKSKYGIESKYVGTRAYAIWIGMRARCSEESTGKSRKNYYEKGIRVCDRWNDFYNFIKDMGEPRDGESIDRIDNTLGYYPENCRWATDKQQANNTSKNKKITFDGKTMNIVEWAEHLGIKPNTLVYRIKRGWGIERAMQKAPKTIYEEITKKKKRNCGVCGKEFVPRKNQIDMGIGKFCSQQCNGLSRKKS